MPIYVREYIRGKVVLVDFQKIVLAEEYLKLVNIRADTDKHIHVICYTANLEKMPPVQILVQTNRLKQGWVIFVNPNPRDEIRQIVASSVLSVLQINTHFVQTVTRAWSILQTVDEALNIPAPPDDIFTNETERLHLINIYDFHV